MWLMNMHSQISGLPKNRVFDEEEVKTCLETEHFCGARRHKTLGIFTNFIALLVLVGYSTMQMVRNALGPVFSKVILGVNPTYAYSVAALACGCVGGVKIANDVREKWIRVSTSEFGLGGKYE